MSVSEDDTFSAGASTLSHWSASFRARFPWLQQAASSEAHHGEYLDEEKENKILACLQGNDETVDLWQLRQLALTRGGLLSSSLRKRAWPILTGAHQHVLLHASNDALPSNLLELSKADMHLLQQDVAQTSWDIEDHVYMARQQEEILNMKNRKKVTFVPGLTSISPSKSESSLASPPPVKSITMEEEVLQSPMSAANFSPNSQGTLESFSAINPVRRTSRQEQKILFNTLTSVLRTPPPEVDHEEDDRFHYYHGLHDLTALLLINLESPSLTSLVLGRLASHPLRDALRSSKSHALEQTVRHSFLPLLEQVDPPLYEHVSKCVEIPSFCIPWIQCWFAQDLLEVRAASRLLDVFLASHALMPIYVAVAMLCHPKHRSTIMNTECDVKTMHSVLRRLPKDMSANEAIITMSILEEMIESAISYMQRFPIQSLQVPTTSSTLWDTPPDWAIASTAPTDWALLQQAKAMRASIKGGEASNGAVVAKGQNCLIHEVTPYALAVSVSGLPVPKKSSWRRESVLFLVVILISLVCCSVALRKAPPTVPMAKIALAETTVPTVQRPQVETTLPRVQRPQVETTLSRIQRPKPETTVPRDQRPKPETTVPRAQRSHAETNVPRDQRLQAETTVPRAQRAQAEPTIASVQLPKVESILFSQVESVQTLPKAASNTKTRNTSSQPSTAMRVYRPEPKPKLASDPISVTPKATRPEHISKPVLSVIIPPAAPPTPPDVATVLSKKNPIQKLGDDLKKLFGKHEMKQPKWTKALFSKRRSVLPVASTSPDTTVVRPSRNHIQHLGKEVTNLVHKIEQHQPEWAKSLFSKVRTVLPFAPPPPPNVATVLPKKNPIQHLGDELGKVLRTIEQKQPKWSRILLSKIQSIDPSKRNSKSELQEQERPKNGWFK